MVCKLPWTDILIEADGLVKSCCFQSSVLGDLKHNTLLEIWNGPGFCGLRAALLNNNYSKYCLQDCPHVPKKMGGA